MMDFTVQPAHSLSSDLEKTIHKLVKHLEYPVFQSKKISLSLSTFRLLVCWVQCNGGCAGSLRLRAALFVDPSIPLPVVFFYPYFSTFFGLLHVITFCLSPHHSVYNRPNTIPPLTPLPFSFLAVNPISEQERGSPQLSVNCEGFIGTLTGCRVFLLVYCELCLIASVSHRFYIRTSSGVFCPTESTISFFPHN